MIPKEKGNHDDTTTEYKRYFMNLKYVSGANPFHVVRHKARGDRILDLICAFKGIIKLPGNYAELKNTRAIIRIDDK